MAIESLIQYLCDSPEPEVYWQDHWFEEVCFSRWAAIELINAIMDHPMVSAMKTIEKFASKMDAFWTAADGTDAEKIFMYAAEFAWGTLDIFRKEYINA